MTTCRAFAISASMAIAVFASSPTGANAATLSILGKSTKVCQLTGNVDWATNQPTAARTDTRFGMQAVDLGFPVDSGTGPLYFLFGDARPSTTGAPIPPDDALGVTLRKKAPDSETCLDLNLVSSAPGSFAHPTVQPSILQGSFNVPTGGAFVGNEFYAFFWTDHCVAAQPLAPLPDTPLKHALPAGPNAACPEIPLFNSIGRSVIARAAPVGSATFDQIHIGTNPFLKTLATMPNGFVYVSAAQTAPTISISISIVPKPPAVPVFGVARYRASIPYLAMAPHDTFGDPDTWSFYAGTVAGQPQWVTRAQWDSGHDASGNWTPPAGAELYADNPFEGLDERCVGEHSVTWNAALHTWLLVYVCGPYHVEARTAPHPWGPWSEPTNLLRYTDPNVTCNLIMPLSGAGCSGLASYWANPQPGIVQPGFFYAPFVMARYTEDMTPVGQTATRQAKIYWLLSTWNPYQVVVMTSTLQMTD